MGCGNSSPSAAAVPNDPNDRAANYIAKDKLEDKPEATSKEEVPLNQDDIAANAKNKVQKLQNSEAAGRIRRKCAEGWLDAAVAYSMCLERGEEWGGNPEDQALRDSVGGDFEEMKNAFESFDIDGDRHVDMKELASALELIGQNPGGEVTDDIKEMFADADVNGDQVVDFMEFLGMMGGTEEEEDDDEDVRPVEGWEETEEGEEGSFGLIGGTTEEG